MSELSVEQLNAIAKFKSELHLPNDGFHTLIIDLSKDYDQPFQVVRKCLKKSQKQIERLISSDVWVTNPVDYQLSHWFDAIHKELKKLSTNNVTVMERFESNEYYQLLQQDPEANLVGNVAELYYSEIYQPLKERLYTSKLFWRLKEDFSEMDSERIDDFREYEQYHHAMLWLKDMVSKHSN